MGLKAYRLWDMGQLDSTCRAPPRGDLRVDEAHNLRVRRRRVPRAVALQVAFERQTLKPAFSVDRL
jgi:hypothetical protein